MKYSLNDFTIDEKIKILTGKNNWENEDLGGKVYKFMLSDGPVGLRTVKYDEEKKEYYTLPAVAFPSTAILAETWNSELGYKMGAALADECIERDVDVLLAPGINVKRLPMCGRNFEYISEDPYLAGVFGREYIKGLQDNHVGACLKHYCANNQEFQRHWQSAEIDERTLREIYTYNFKIACEAKPWTLMSSYNLVNGQRMSEHKKLYTMLREEFGFDGLIMSDWWAVKNHAASIRGTLDLEMPFVKETFENVKTAYEKGELTEEEIDKRVLKVLELCDLLESEKAKREVKTTVDERYELAEKIAEEGIVLLKNNGVLPLKNGEEIACIGNAVTKGISGGGSSTVVPGREVKKLDEELKKLLPDSKVTNMWPIIGHENTTHYLRIVTSADVSVILAEHRDAEGTDRLDLKLPWEEEARILEVVKHSKKTVVVLLTGSVIDVSAWEDKVDAIIYAGYPGESGNAPLAKILAGAVSPSGKLTETWPVSPDDCLATRCYRDFMHSVYSDGLLVGYRWYDTAKYKMDKADEARVRYPFGHGLSYTSFEYSGLELKVEGENIKVDFDVTNTGKVDAKESVQIYFHDKLSYVFRPYKELCGFEKKLISAGKTEHYSVNVPKEYLAYYSTSKDEWVVEWGDYDILVGASCDDIRLEGKITL